MSTLAVLGPGRLGTALARVALAAGQEVRVAGRVRSEGLRLLVEVVAPGAAAVDASAAVARADFVVLALPIRRLDALDPVLLAGRTVVDAMNHWAPVDGELPGLADAARGTSGIVADRLPESRIVKTLHHIGYHELETDGRPRGAVDRRALGVAADDPEAAVAVGAFVDSIGFDPVLLPSLAISRLLEPGTRIFGGWSSAAEIRAEATAAFAPPGTGLPAG